MASFRFNFGREENENHNDHLRSKVDEIKPLEAKEVFVPKDIVKQDDIIDKIVINEETFLFLNIEHVEDTLKKTSTILDDSSSNTDLVPAVYEGGLKIWECTIDLVEYLDKHKVSFQEKRVLEVGCGAGIPGLYALKNGALVDFQDYNDDVLTHFTVPNVFLNLEACYSKSSSEKIRDIMCKKCHFFAGDWKLLEDFINPEKKPNELYDIILTSETIYNVSNYKKLIDFFRKHLKFPDGIVYIAAKTHYFGVGGGTRSFEQVVKGSNDFNITVCQRFSDGLQREILMIKWDRKNYKSN